MRESAIEKKFKTEVEKLGGLALKFVPLYFTGMPDRIVLLPKGRIYFVELKAPGEQPRKRQIIVHKQLTKLGFIAKTIDTIEKIQEFIQEVGE